MKLRTGTRRFLWQTRTGAFGFYAEGAARAVARASRLVSPMSGPRPRGRVLGAMVLMLLVGPLALVISERSWSIRHAALLTSPAAGHGEVASLRGPLVRYYERREAGASREFAIPVVVSAYTSRPCETDSTPFITAANTRTRPGVIALSRDLLKRYTPGAPFDFGDVVHLTGIGDFVVEDSMNSRWESRADIWFENLGDARRFGRRKLVMTGPYGVVEKVDLTGARRITELASTRASASP